MLRAYWWDPRRPLRSLLGESINHGCAWAHIVLRGPTKFQNFGDAVNPIILREITGQQIRWAPLGREDVVCVGSILNSYAARGGVGAILGSGVRQPADSLREDLSGKRILALRGFGTAHQLGVSPDSIALGDPGLVVRNLIRATSTRRRGLFVPHFAAMASKSIRSSLARARSLGLDIALPNEDPLVLAQKIAESDYLLTTSLHALVFADALGIRAQRVEFQGTGTEEPDFKYRDYESVFGVASSVLNFNHWLRDGLTDAVKSTMEEREGLVETGIDKIIDGIYNAGENL